MEDTITSVELDEYAGQAWRDLLDARAAETEAKARVAKAHQTVLDFLLRAGEDVGTIDGRPAVRLVEFDRETVDTTRLRQERPYLAREYTRATTVRQLRAVTS